MTDYLFEAVDNYSQATFISTTLDAVGIAWAMNEEIEKDQDDLPKMMYKIYVDSADADSATNAIAERKRRMQTASTSHDSSGNSHKKSFRDLFDSDFLRSFGNGFLGAIFFAVLGLFGFTLCSNTSSQSVADTKTNSVIIAPVTEPAPDAILEDSIHSELQPFSETSVD